MVSNMDGVASFKELELPPPEIALLELFVSLRTAPERRRRIAPWRKRVGTEGFGMGGELVTRLLPSVLLSRGVTRPSIVGRHGPWHDRYT